MTRKKNRRSSGFALVTTLLVVTVVMVILVAFLQSMRMEHLATRVYLDRAEMEFLSDIPLQAAIERIRGLEEKPKAAVFFIDKEEDGSRSPYLFHVWCEQKEGSEASIAHRSGLFSTVRDRSDYVDGGGGGGGTIWREPFQVEDIDIKGHSVTRAVEREKDIKVDINFRMPGTGEDIGFVGLRNEEGDLLPIEVNWRYVHNKEGRVIGRYAFWTDDECAKLDLRTAGNLDGEDGSYVRKNGANLNEVSLRPLMRLGLSKEQVSSLVTFRENQLGGGEKAVSSRSFRYAFTEDEGDALWSRIEPHLTVYSRSDDRSPDGKRRLNLNAVVTDTNDPERIKREVWAIRDAIEEVCPRFKERAFSIMPQEYTDDDKERLRENYLLKLACNIRDFIDHDSIATVVLKNDEIYVGREPDPELDGTLPFSGLNTSIGRDDLPRAFGKERGPFLNEYTCLMKAVSGPQSGIGTVVVRPVHYIEFHNITGQEIRFEDLGEQPFVRISNRAPWRVTSGEEERRLRPVDIKMFLPHQFVVPANGYAVITTDDIPFFWDGSLKNISSDEQMEKIGFRYFKIRRAEKEGAPNPGEWVPVNAAGSQSHLASDYAEDYEVDAEASELQRRGDRSHPGIDTIEIYTIKSDVREEGYTPNENGTRLLFGNSEGLIDFVVRAYEETIRSVGRNQSNPTFHNTNLAGNDTTTTKNGSSGRRYSLGDPRTNTEVIDPACANTKSTWIAGGSGYGYTLFDIGNLNESERHDPAKRPMLTLGGENHSTNYASEYYGKALPEWTTEGLGSHWVENGKLWSLGQLGYIYDPARYEISRRGGGRTLRIGQADDPSLIRSGVTGSENRKRWLGGRGSSDPASSEYAYNAFHLLDVFRIDDVCKGRINLMTAGSRGPVPIGLLALTDHFVFDEASEDGIAVLAGKKLKENNAAGLSEVFVPFLNPAEDKAVSLQSVWDFLFCLGKDRWQAVLPEETTLRKVPDSGREEWFRRTSNLITNYSLAYTVHGIVQSGRFENNSFKRDAVVRRKTVVQLVPKYPEPYDDLKRQAPESWEVRIVRDEVL